MSNHRLLTDKHYFTGDPCARGHVTLRYLSNGKCVDCGASEKKLPKYKATAAKREKKNREQLKAYRKEWRKINRERNREYSRTYRLKNLSALHEKERARRAGNKENNVAKAKLAAAASKRRAAKLSATPKWADLMEIESIYFLCSEKSFTTGHQYTVDHIVPLVNSAVCGLHVPWNLQIMPMIENARKGNKTDLEGHGMLDEEFIRQLVIFNEQGADGKPAMWALLKQEGNMRRLITLAARGITPKRSRAKATIKTRIHDDFPGEMEKHAAIIYWQGKRRPDLVARTEEIAERFHDHYLGSGERAESWPAKWRTWYSNAIEFNKPPRGTSLAEAPVLFEQCPIPTWVLRLEIHAGMLGTPESPGRKGTWSAKWGPPPDQSGSRVPPEARTLFEEKHAPQRRLPV